MKCPPAASFREDRRKQWPRLERQNGHTRIFNNAAATINRDNRENPFPDGPNLSHNFQEAGLKLRAPGEMDFRPAEDSPLIDAGRPVPGVTGSYMDAAPDIGAYEHGATRWVPGITWKPRE